MGELMKKTKSKNDCEVIIMQFCLTIYECYKYHSLK